MSDDQAKHLYQIDDGDTIVASSREEALRLWADLNHYDGVELAAMWDSDPIDYVEELPDERDWHVTDIDEPGQPVTRKTCGEWANEFPIGAVISMGDV